MYLKVNNAFVDGDYNHLCKYLSLLDTEFIPLCKAIDNSRDPESDGLCDYGEYIVGSAYGAVQRYFSSTYPQRNLDKDEALSRGPSVVDDLTFAQAVNAGANYWKHMEEWGLTNVVTRDIDSLPPLGRRTILTIEKATPWSDYTCSNLLAEILGKKEMKLIDLLYLIEKWRSEVDCNEEKPVTANARTAGQLS